jgi:acyl dehydratase
MATASRGRAGGRASASALTWHERAAMHVGSHARKLARRTTSFQQVRSSMPVNTKAIGKVYEPITYAVGREKIREYARAVGETNPLHLDVDAARAAGHADVVAPPMFAVVYSAPSVGPPIFDPEIELNFAMMVHGAQEFVWGPPVLAGDEIETVATVKDISERDGRGYYVFESVSRNQRGEEVCRGTWTNIVRGV